MIRSKMARTAEIVEYIFNGKKEIELFGMYGAQNIGDEAMKVVGLATFPAGRTVATVPSSRIPVVGAMLAAKVRPHLVFGGGTLIHGGAEDGANSWLEFAERFISAGATIGFFGTGISFLEEQIAARTSSVQRWAEVLGKSPFVGVRGPLSQSQAAELGVKVEIFGDAAFALHRVGQADIARNAGLFGFNFGECLGDQPAYEAISAQLLRVVAQQFHCAIYVVRPSDRDATQRIIDQSGVASDRYEIVEIFEDVVRYIDSVAQCHAFIGLKLHASGLAMVAGVPSLLFGYEKKCRDFMLPIEMEHALVEMDSGLRVVESQVNDLLSNPERYRNDGLIGEIAARQRQTIEDYFRKD